MLSDPKQVATPHPTPDATVRQHAQEMEWKHFRFAMVLLFGAVLGLPTIGAFYVLMIRWGWVASPMGH